jgi:hypothetical protein
MILTDESLAEGGEILTWQKWRFLQHFYRKDYAEYIATYHDDGTIPLDFEEWYTEFILEPGNDTRQWD